MDARNDAGARAFHCPERNTLLPGYVACHGIFRDANREAQLDGFGDSGANATLGKHTDDAEVLHAVRREKFAKLGIGERTGPRLREHGCAAEVFQPRIWFCALATSDGSALSKEVGYSRCGWKLIEHEDSQSQGYGAPGENIVRCLEHSP